MLEFDYIKTVFVTCNIIPHTMHFLVLKKNILYTIYHSIFLIRLLVGSCYSIFSFICMFCGSWFVLLSFFFWPLCCLSFFDFDQPFGILLAPPLCFFLFFFENIIAKLFFQIFFFFQNSPIQPPTYKIIGALLVYCHLTRNDSSNSFLRLIIHFQASPTYDCFKRIQEAIIITGCI